MPDEQIASLNQIIAIIDEKAAKFREEVYDMPAARRGPEKEMILKLIGDARSLADQIQPKPFSLLEDFSKLEMEMQRY